MKKNDSCGNCEVRHIDFEMGAELLCTSAIDSIKASSSVGDVLGCNHIKVLLEWKVPESAHLKKLLRIWTEYMEEDVNDSHAKAKVKYFQKRLEKLEEGTA